MGQNLSCASYWKRSCPWVSIPLRFLSLDITVQMPIQARSWGQAALQASPVAQMVKRLPAMQETQVQFLGWEDPLEKEMATHCSILVWKIPWMEEPGGLHSMGLQRVGTWLSDLLLTLLERMIAGTSLVVQWLRICLAVQGTRFDSWLRRIHMSWSDSGCVPQLLCCMLATREATATRSLCCSEE